jgi:peptide/nickel transport system substrate-binding protein
VLRRFVLSLPLTAWLAAACMIAMTGSACARTRPHYGGLVRVEVEGDPLQKPDGMAWRLILDGLTRMDSEGAVRPSLAVRWSSEDSDHRWQFWLRTGVSFQDNRPLNSLAVVTSLEESCRVSPCPWTAVRVLGQSVVFTSGNAMPELPSLLAESEFLIRETSPETGGLENGIVSLVIGTGSFRVKESSTNRVRLEANDDCWQGRPFVDSIEIEGHRPMREQWMDLSLAKADAVEVHASDIRQARQQRMNVVVSPAVMLLELEIHNAGLAPQLRAAIAVAVDRAALYQVIFQKQGEITASLLPDSVSGYSFLFSSERDLSRAQALRGGLTPPPLTIAVDGTGAMQLAAERLALNLHDAGFSVRVVPAGPNGFVPPADLVLRMLPLMGGTPSEALDGMFRRLGMNALQMANDDIGTYKAERDFLDQHAVIPLLYLPRAWAVSGRLRDLGLTAESLPDLANASLPNGVEVAP